MIRNYLKTAFRSLVRNRSYAIINIAGLAIGLAACLLIFLVIRFETGFDRFHPDKEQIYRTGSVFQTQDGISYSPGIAFPAAKAFRVDFPWLKNVASIFEMGDGQITVDVGKEQKKFNAISVYFAEPEFFSMFHFPWLAGDPKTVMEQPNQVAITKELAEKFFGDWKNAIGKTIKHDNLYTYQVAGIMENMPYNTDFPLSVVVSYNTLASTHVKRNLDDWVSTFSQSYTFVALPKGYPVTKFNDQLATFAKKHKPEENAKDGYIAQPLSDIHYNSDFGNFRGHTFSRSLITALGLIAAFLVLIACVNFVNLATAQAINRSKEVGVRKVMGGRRGQLAFQFFSETAIITTVAMLAAVVIAYLALPFFNHLLDIHLALNFISNPELFLFLAGAVTMVTLLAGFYPALVLSRFNPIAALSSRVAARMGKGINLRRALVIVQFGIAHVLIIGTFIVVSQMNFFRNASLGFDKSAIINVPIPGDSASLTRVDALKNELAGYPGISNVSFSFSPPSSRGSWNSDFRYDHNPKSTNFSANLKWADADYFKTYHLQFVAGRPYENSDTVREFVVNETLLRKLGIRNPEDAIGKQIDFWDGNTVAPIVGVVRDFNSSSLREPMAPVVLGTWKDVYQTINIRINPGALKGALAFAEKTWNKTYPDNVYEYRFLDETIQNFYEQEHRLSQLYKIFAGIAILISCLGLYGLVSFMAVQRTKEMGIRKVLGASSGHIVFLLSKEFTVLILVAFGVAAPIAWWVMHQWLLNYSYRIAIGVPVFLLAVAGSILVAWITVGYRAIQAAVANPVTSLRTE